MIASNSDKVEQIIDAWRALKPIPPELVDDGIEWVNPPDAIEGGTRSGHSGFDEAQSAFRQAYSSLEFDIERVETSGDDVMVEATVLVVGRGSGIEVPQRMGLLFTFHQGKVSRFEWSNDPDEMFSR